MGSSKLENFEAIAFLSLLSINGIILSSSQHIVNMCGSSTLINVLLISLISLFLTFILCKLSKNFLGQSLLDISEYLGGKPFKFIIGLLFIGYFILRSSIFLKKISICLQIVYYPMTNIIFIIALFCIALGIVACLSNNSVPKSAVIILPILLITIILIFCGNLKNFNFENIYPIFGNNINSTFISGMSNIFAFCELAYLFFLPPKLKNPEKITKISLISISLSAIFLVFCCASTLLLLGEDFSNSGLLPIYLSVRCIEFGTFFQRLDAIFLLLCILCFICVVSLNLYIVIDILKNLSSVSETKPLMFSFIFIIFGVALCLQTLPTLKFLETDISKIVYIIMAIIVPFTLLLFANFKQKLTK